MDSRTIEQVLRSQLFQQFDCLDREADRLLDSQKPFDGEQDVLLRRHQTKPLVLDAVRYGPGHLRIHVWKQTADAEYVLFSITRHEETWRISSGNRNLVFQNDEVAAYEFLYTYLFHGGLLRELAEALAIPGRLLGYGE